MVADKEAMWKGATATAAATASVGAASALCLTPEEADFVIPIFLGLHLPPAAPRPSPFFFFIHWRSEEDSTWVFFQISRLPALFSSIQFSPAPRRIRTLIAE